MPTRKRAWLYVIRNQKRTALLLILFTVLLTITLLGQALNAACGDAIRALRSSIGGYISIQAAAESKQNTDEELLDQVRTLDNISRYNGIDTYYMYTGELELIPGSYRGTNLAGEHVPKLVACTDSSLHERFVGTSFLLEEGRHITEGDLHKAMISKELAYLNNLTVGDTIVANVIEGVPGWLSAHYGTGVTFEIVGIYQIARSEPSDATTPESELQENMIFTDISTAKELYAVKFPDRPADSFIYGSGIYLFLDDPALMSETVNNIKAQPYADWDGFIITGNDTMYQSTATPIQQAETLSFVLLLVILVLSIGILTLVLIMWTRERMAEIGILISLGIPSDSIVRQIVLENYMVALPSFSIAMLLSISLSGSIDQSMDGMLAELQIAHYIGPLQAALVLACAVTTILIAALLAAIPVMRKKPRDILTDLS